MRQSHHTTIMDVEKLFHMNGGGAGQNSYARNSSLQQKAASDMVKHITLETIRELYMTTPARSLGIADLGCSSGPNTLSIVKELVETVEAASHKALRDPPAEFRVYLNDLPSNDFNAIFKALPDFYAELRKGRNYDGPAIYIAAYPGTFYGRLFPDNCLHFVYSSYSLHWLSRVPKALYDGRGRSINKGNIYISRSSPPQVAESYLGQFRQDFSLFLRSRSKELVRGGRMVLILLGRRDADHVDRGNAFFWELLSRSFKALVSEGEIDEEKLDSYEVHFYAASKEEVQEEVRKEGSFEIERFEWFQPDRVVSKRGGRTYGTEVAMTVRAVQESMISHHFGGDIVNSLFEEYGRLVDEEMAKEDIRPITFVLVLRNL